MRLTGKEILYKKFGPPIEVGKAYKYLLDNIYLEDDFIMWFKKTIDSEKTDPVISKRFVLGYYKFTLPENKIQRFYEDTEDLENFREEVRSILSRVVAAYDITSKEIPSAIDIIGCTLEDFKDWIEMQFTGNMSWNDRSTFHIDHKVPLAVALNKEEALKLNHFTNLRPMEPVDNLKKGSKMLKEFQPLAERLLGRVPLASQVNTCSLATPSEDERSHARLSNKAL